MFLFILGFAVGDRHRAGELLVVDGHRPEDPQPDGRRAGGHGHHPAAAGRNEPAVESPQSKKHCNQVRF